MSPCALLVTVTLFALAAAATDGSLYVPIATSPPPKSLETIEWDAGVGFLDSLARKGLPVLIANSPAARFAATGKWSPDYLTAAAGSATLTQVWTSASPAFVHSDRHHVTEYNGSWAGTNVRPAHGETALTLAELFSAIAAAEAPSPPGAPLSYVYWNGGLAAFAPPGSALDGDISPRSALFFGPDEQTALWIGSAGVRLAMHYDAQDNLYSQLYGRKRFFLMHPSFELAVCLHPTFHPSYFSSQVDHLSAQSSTARCPDSEAVRGHLFEVELSPGQMLYIPPYWFHLAEARTTSISLSIHSTSKPVSSLNAAISALFRLPIAGIPETSTPAEVGFLVRVYLELVEALAQTEGWIAKDASLARLLLRARYRPWFGAIGARDASVAALCPWMASPAAVPLADEFVAPIVDAMRAALGGRFVTIVRALGPLRLMVLQHWLENLLATAAPSLHEMPALLTHCFAPVRAASQTGNTDAAHEPTRAAVGEL